MQSGTRGRDPAAGRPADATGQRLLGPAGRVPLERALSKLGLLSRTQARAAIEQGRVVVDGQVVRDPQLPVVPERIAVELDGQPQQSAVQTAPVVLALHKPRGYLTTARDPQGRPTVFDLLRDAPAGLVAVGRLDAATTGLLLLTSDTQLANKLTDPSTGIERIYLVEVEGRVGAQTAERLVQGVRDGNDLLRAEHVQVRKSSGKESQLLLTLTEGKNREVRRMCAAVGHPVRRLKRVQYGPVALGQLAPGSWQVVDSLPLYQACQLAPPQERASGLQRGGRGP